MALAWLLAIVVYLPLAIGGILIGNRIRAREFDRLAVRSSEMVSAIQLYAATYGRPPVSLDALVPDYLPSVPSTGMMAYPRYVYHSRADAQRYNGNPRVLVIDTPSGGINFDKFLYFPSQNYPKRGYGGSLRRVCDWAYVHE